MPLGQARCYPGASTEVLGRRTTTVGKRDDQPKVGSIGADLAFFSFIPLAGDWEYDPMYESAPVSTPDF